MTRTVLLNCPIKAEIRAVDSQSDLRILLVVMITGLNKAKNNKFYPEVCTINIQRLLALFTSDVTYKNS